MNGFFQKTKRIITSSALFLLIGACGSDGEFSPNYSENAVPEDRQEDRQVDGELAFSSPSLMKMGESFRIAGDYTNAIRFYQRAANQSPAHVSSRLALGQIYQRLGATDGAITYYRQVLALDSENGDAQLGLGQMMMNKDRPLEAVEYLEAAAAKSPENFRIYNSIGLAYDLEGLHAQAQNAYGNGLSRNPDHISLLNNLALSMAFEDEFAASIRLLSKAINLDYSQTTAQHNLVMVYALSGEEQAARAMARTMMTPDEIEDNMYRYKWLKGLSSKRRAKAIFLSLSSFPDEEILKVGNDPLKTHPTVSMDPKRQMLKEILNAEDDVSELSAPPEQLVQHDPEEAAPVVADDVTPLSHYQLQLGSYGNEADVNDDWRRLQNMAPEILANQDIEIRQVLTADNQTRYRLVLGQFDNFSAAEQNCLALKDRNVPCLVKKSSNN